MLYLLENVINELAYKELMGKQKSITKLFPPFFNRVDSVAKNGGVKLVSTKGNTWDFLINSGTVKGKQYDAHVRFKGLKQKIGDAVKDKSVWKSDMSGVDRRKLASKLFYDLDLQLDCTCPSFLYWGFAYITTKNIAKYGDLERRPPKVRNPKEFGAICKHLHLLLSALPMYIATFAKFLDRFYSKDIRKAEEEFKNK